MMNFGLKKGALRTSDGALRTKNGALRTKTYIYRSHFKGNIPTRKGKFNALLKGLSVQMVVGPYVV